MYISMLLLLPLVSGCAGPSPDFTKQYLEALEQRPGAPVDPTWLDRFVTTYQAFDTDSLGQALRQLYASDLYFNDTLRSWRHRNELVDYLQHTAERLDSMELTVLDRRIDGGDAFIRWTMRTRFSIGWRDVDVTTLGISHLRFNPQGQVVMHQDFWDSRQGIFEHMPLLGGMTNWVRSKL